MIYIPSDFDDKKDQLWLILGLGYQIIKEVEHEIP